MRRIDGGMPILSVRVLDSRPLPSRRRRLEGRHLAKVLLWYALALLVPGGSVIALVTFLKRK